MITNENFKNENKTLMVTTAARNIMAGKVALVDAVNASSNDD